MTSLFITLKPVLHTPLLQKRLAEGVKHFLLVKPRCSRPLRNVHKMSETSARCQKIRRDVRDLNPKRRLYFVHDEKVVIVVLKNCTILQYSLVRKTRDTFCYVKVNTFLIFYKFIDTYFDCIRGTLIYCGHRYVLYL